MATRRIVIEFKEDLVTVIYEGSKFTYYIANLRTDTGKFTIHNEVNKDIISVVADALLSFGNSIKTALKRHV